ncbi:VWA domain-containing protein [Candidatus Sumerlaeota bacterium]|nr:VWA domain-containing protein [Candidatus Sumerlaeota bacterium]
MGLSRIISLAYPELLLLGLVLVYLYVRRLSNRNWWRLVMLLCAILLLGYPVLLHRTKSLDLFLVMDRSRSISEQGYAKQMEILDLVSRNMLSGDRLGIVSFNEKAFIEQAPGSQSVVKSFHIPFSPDASELSEGVQAALSLAKKDRNSRMLVLSDGEYTGRNPFQEAQIARQRKIPVFYRNLKRAEIFNLTIRDIDTPGKILTSEPFRIVFKVSSTTDTPGRYRLYRNDQVMGASENEGWRSRNFQAGNNILSFTDTTANPGIYSYRLEVEAIPRDKETFFSDNSGERFINVVGERPILVVNNTGNADNISQILSAGGLPSHIINISDFHMTLNQMEGYKGIILNNVPILDLTRSQIMALKDFVMEEGGGLLVCGGESSFARGGYYKTALETALPVSLEDRNQSKKISAAFSIVLDRSGSMQMTTPSGETKMSLANNAAVESLNLLTPMDSVSIIAVDSIAHIIVPQQPAEDVSSISSRIRKIESMGGGIFVYEALVAAGSQLVNASQLNKHILLFSDAADSEEPGAYRELLAKYAKANITVSVVGLGRESDHDAELLRDIARLGNGQVYFTEDAGQLIQFFTADTISYVRQSFITEPAPMGIKAAAYIMSPDQKWNDFTCSHYNLMFPKPGADVAIRTADEDSAPVLAFWQRGVGRVATMALDVEGPFTSTPHYGDIMLSAVRWIMGSNVFDNLLIKTASEGSFARVRMEVSSEEREKMGAARIRIFTPGGESFTRPLLWDGYNKLSASYRMNETGCYRGVVEMGDKIYKIGPMSLPVSPEFIHEEEPAFGKKTLEQFADVSGGKEILNVSELFERSVSSAITAPVVTPFLILFLILLVVDIAEQRFGLQRMIRLFLRNQKERVQKINVPKVWKTVFPRKIGKKKSPFFPGEKAEEQPPLSPEQPAPAEQKGDMDYLTAAKNKVRKRFGKK